ncbi:MAG: VWA domain-containing protein [Mobilitalea sp.]
MKKILVVILCLMLIMTCIFTGCSKKENGLVDKAGEIKNGQNNYSNETQSVQDVQQTQGTNAQAEQELKAAEDTEDNLTGNYEMDGGIAITQDSAFNGNVGYSWEEPMPPASEEYTEIDESGFLSTTQNPLSTFSIDVDTASYANLRKNINYGILPEKDAVRIEEMLNYFSYEYKEPTGDVPFSINTEIGKCPWNEERYLLKVGIQGKNVDMESLPKSNLVFLIDVSGSMDESDKLPLLQNAFSQLVQNLGENDRVSIVVYAGNSGVVLNSVPGNEKRIILDAIGSLSAGGSTGGAEGIERAYQLAEKNFIRGGNNRVILATDGDFNVGPSSPEELEALIEEKRDSGIYLSVIGFGSGNLKDNRMETLADKGNGNYSYIDSPKEARKVLVDEMSGTLLTIAKDVKIQLEFNPYYVDSYRLIGYENRALKDEDFENDTVDAGELGAGHSVTAIYEIVPSRAAISEKEQKELKYQSQETVINEEYKDEITEIRLRYKKPDGDTSKEIKQVVYLSSVLLDSINLSEDFYFSAAVAEFGMLLRDSEYMGNTTTETILKLAKQGLGEDQGGYRSEFIDIVKYYNDLFSYQW